MGRLLPFAAKMWAHPAKLMQGAKYRAALARVPYRTGAWPVAADGMETLAGVRLSGVPLTDGRRTWTEACDLLACGSPGPEYGVSLVAWVQAGGRHGGD